MADVFIFIGLAACFGSACTLSLPATLALAPWISAQPAAWGSFGLVDALCALLFLGAMGKSAQLGLHTWLPDAMEGPTPVSALIHAATMVTAGVFLVVRCSLLFEYSSLVLRVISLVGALTAFAAATIALAQHDIKKVVAYSTCSQLGYMFFACGLSNYSAGLFHLFNHAFFKALLFLSAGALIHGAGDEQDMRRLGGSARLMPATYACVLLGSLSLAGTPFLSGFYSKDLILETASGSYELTGLLAYWLGTLTAFLTAFYSLRVLWLSFAQAPGAARAPALGLHEPGVLMLAPMAALAVGSIFSGYLFRDLFVGMGSAYSPLVGAFPCNLPDVSAEFAPATRKLLPAICSASGMVISVYLYSYSARGVASAWSAARGVLLWLSNKWYFDKVYNAAVVRPVMRSGYGVFFAALDRGVVE